MSAFTFGNNTPSNKMNRSWLSPLWSSVFRMSGAQTMKLAHTHTHSEWYWLTVLILQFLDGLINLGQDTALKEIRCVLLSTHRANTHNHSWTNNKTTPRRPERHLGCRESCSFSHFYLLHADLDLCGLGSLLRGTTPEEQMRNYFSLNFHEPETIGLNL